MKSQSVQIYESSINTKLPKPRAKYLFPGLNPFGNFYLNHSPREIFSITNLRKAINPDISNQFKRRIWLIMKLFMSLPHDKFSYWMLTLKSNKTVFIIYEMLKNETLKLQSGPVVGNLDTGKPGVSN